MKRTLKCEACNGTGSKSKVSNACQRCHGAGVENVVRQLAPGMITQMQRPCSNCRGKGTTRKPGDDCKVCKGECLIEDAKRFEITLEKGAPDGHKVVLRGEAGITEPGLEPGDVVFLFHQTKDENDSWRRQGNDILLMDFQISLKQALCASELHLRHLDGHVVNMKREPGAPIKPSEWVCIPDEGMPILNRPYSKGNLYVRFTVVMPTTLPQEMLAQIAAMLPDDGESTVMDTDDAEEVKMADVGTADRLQEELQMRMRAYRQQASAYDSDEEEAGPQRVQCAQQ
jgi:DnaJ homolog subfamily A member 2